MRSKTWYPGAGGINGTTTRNTFDAKKTQTAAVYARNGGFQPNATTDSGLECMYRSPPEISVLINERG